MKRKNRSETKAYPEQAKGEANGARAAAAYLRVEYGRRWRPPAPSLILCCCIILFRAPLLILFFLSDKHNDFSGALPAMDAFDPRADEYLLSTHTRCSGSNAIITSQKVTITHSKTCITALTRIIKGTAIMITWKQFSFAHLQDK